MDGVELLFTPDAGCINEIWLWQTHPMAWIRINSTVFSLFMRNVLMKVGRYSGCSHFSWITYDLCQVDIKGLWKAVVKAKEIFADMPAWIKGNATVMIWEMKKSCTQG